MKLEELIDTYLTEGQSILKIHRIGAGKDTQYACLTDGPILSPIFYGLT